MLRLLVLLIIAVGGGSLGLALGNLTSLRIGLATVGILVTLVLLVAA